MEVGVSSVVREILVMLRSLVGIGAHVRVCGGSSGGKGGLICRRAVFIRSVEVVLRLIGEFLRTNGFIGVGGSKIHVPWGVGMRVAIHRAVRSGVIFVHTGLARSSGPVRWSLSPIE